MRAGTGEFLYSMTCLPSPFLVIVREKTGARQGPRRVRPSPDHTSIGHSVQKQPTPPIASFLEGKLAGAEGFEPSPSSLTVRCPTSWTTPQRAVFAPDLSQGRSGIN